MLVVRPRIAQGAGIFDVFTKVANSTLAKKVINSAVGKKIVEQATKENLKRVANSAIGKQLQTAVVKGVADATEKAANTTFQKLGVAPQPGVVGRISEKAVNSGLQKLGLSGQIPEKATLEKVFAATTIPTRKRKRKNPSTPGRRKKTKRAKAVGTGIIWE